MANTKQMETTLLTEHFRWTPITLIDDIINAVNEIVSRSIDGIENALVSTDPRQLGFADKAAATKTTIENDSDGKPIYPDAQPEIENGVHQLETLLDSNVDRNFDKFEIYVLRNVLTVPGDVVGWVKLQHYEGLPSPSAAVKAPSPVSLHLLRRKLQEMRRLQTALEAERSRNALIISQLRSLLNGSHAELKQEQPTSAQLDGAADPTKSIDFSFLTQPQSAKSLGVTFSTTDSTKQGPLSTHTSFLLSQLPSLRSLLTQLRPALPSLPTNTTRTDFDDSTKAAERRQYIESQTRRTLERRGVDVEGGAGMVQGGGRTAEEVRALESVVGMLERTQERSDDVMNHVGAGAGDDQDEMDQS